MISNQMRVEPTGPADDAPAISHVPTVTGPRPDLAERAFTALLDAPWYAQLTVVVLAFALVGCLIMVLVQVLRGVTNRLRGTDKHVERTDAQRAESARQRAERFTYTIGAYGSSVSLANSLYVVRHVPQGNPVVWATFIAIAVLYELFVLMLGARALANAYERGRLGREGALLWVAVGLIAVFIYSKQEDETLRTTAAIPLLTGLAWALYLSSVALKVRIDKGSTENKAEDFSELKAATNPISVLWRQATAWMGLVEERGYGVLARYRRRQAIQLAQMAFRLDALRKADGGESTEEYRELERRYFAAVAKLAGRYPSDVAFTEAVRPAFGLIFGAGKSATQAVAEAANPWIADPAATGTAGATGSADPAGTGSAGTGSGTGSGAGGGGTAAGRGTGTGSARAAATGTKMTVGEVETVRSSWTAEERAARQDYEVARAHATEVGKAVLGETGQAKAGMRAYFLVMCAAKHEVKPPQMRLDVTGQRDDNGAGRTNYRTWKAELAADAHDGEVTAEQASENGTK